MNSDQQLDATAALVSSHFAAAAQSALRQGDALAQGVALAADRIVQCFLQNRKLLVFAQDLHRADGDALVARMLGQLEQTRPALPAFRLNALPIASAQGLTSGPLLELQALGNAGDVIVALTVGCTSVELEALAAVARERGVQVIWLAQTRDEAVAAARDEADIVIWFDEQRIIRILELQRIAVHALADAIDSLLLGDGA